MPLTRRTFLGLGSLAACGAAAGGCPLFAAETQALPGGLPFSLDEKKTLAFVRSYTANFRVVGASVLGRIRKGEFGELHVLAEVDARGPFHGALAGAKFAGMHAQENSLTFPLADVDVTIENLLPDLFAARLAAMGKREGNAFAHDALACNLETGELSDPFAAQAGGVKLTDTTFTGPAALDVALRGTLEAALLGISEEKSFVKWKSGVLGADATAGDAQRLAVVFLQHLTTLADRLPGGSTEALLRSRIVATALKKARGTDADAAIARFKKLRAKSGIEISNAAVWLAALMAQEIKTNAAGGAATVWFRNGTRFQVLRSRAALAQAQAVLQG